MVYICNQFIRDLFKKVALILNSRSNATAGNVPASDVSSPDLGVDLGSDPFSSLERTNDISLVQQLGNYILVGPIFVDFCLRPKPGFLLRPDTETKNCHNFRLNTENNRNHQIFQIEKRCSNKIEEFNYRMHAIITRS